MRIRDLLCKVEGCGPFSTYQRIVISFEFLMGRYPETEEARLCERCGLIWPKAQPAATDQV